MYKRPYFKDIFKRLEEPRRFIQVLSGPRQAGKTTLIQQVLENIRIPSHYAAADALTADSPSWIEQQWDIARLKLGSLPKESEFILVLDEIQKIPAWSETVKKLWDEDTRKKFRIKVVLLGSASLLLQKGLTESLAGRFELFRISHWSYAEMRDAFNFKLEQYIYFGGYPGAAPLVSDEERWKFYIRDSLIETTIARDVLMMTRIDKPALLRRLFEMGCLYSGRILSYNKMIGQLQDAGNTTTLSHYLDLLSMAGVLTGLQKYSREKVRQRASSPKLQVLNTALITAQAGDEFKESRGDSTRWGHLVESSVGAHLVNTSLGKDIGVFYWRERGREVDFVLEKKGQIVALEVKSGRTKDSLPGIAQFSKKYKTSRKLLVGKGGLELEEYFRLTAGDLF